MLIRCPNCRTTYKVSDDLLKGGTAPAFRCSRCKYTFELELEEAPLSTAAPRADAKLKAVPTSSELPLPFTHGQQTEQIENKAPAFIDATAKVENPEDAKVDRAEPWSISDGGQQEERSFTFTDATPSMRSEKVVDAAEDFTLNEPVFPNMDLKKETADTTDNILPMTTYLEQRASIFPYLTLFVLLVVGYALAAVISYAHPIASEEIVKKIPLIGASVLRNSHLKEGIAIQSLRAGYQTIQGNREVFLINGVAVNQNPVMIREIQISGKIYNNEGKELEHRTIWAGNTMSPKILRGMTLEDIPHLQNLKPLKTFEVPPGDSVPFTIVFLRSKNAKDFSCQVISAESDA